MALLEQEFHRAMFEAYKRAKSEYRYNATRFLQMLDEHGGVSTAHILLQAEGVSEGYIALWERGGLEITVESLVLNPRWKSLFSPEELQTARRRLQKYDFDVAVLEAVYAAKQA